MISNNIKLENINQEVIKLKNINQEVIELENINQEVNNEDLEKEFNKLITNVKKVKKNYNSDKKFASASLTFAHSSRGYLLCNEYRWGEKKDLYHLIGGKIEKTDMDILFTAVREFVEETNIFMDNTIVMNKDIEYISKKIYNQIKEKVKYLDLTVNREKKLFHRFFLFDINKFKSSDLRKKIINLPKYMEKLEEKDNKELNFLLWINGENKELISNEFSYMLNVFNKNINNFIAYI